MSRNTSIGQKRAATPLFTPSPKGLGFSFVHIFDPRAFFDVAQWGGDPYYAPLYYFRMRSMVEEFIPSRFHNERKKAFRSSKRSLETRKTPMTTPTCGEIVGLFARIYGPEKGWQSAGQGPKTYYVGDFRNYTFFDALDQALQALIKTKGQWKEGLSRGVKPTEDGNEDDRTIKNTPEFPPAAAPITHQARYKKMGDRETQDDLPKQGATTMAILRATPTANNKAWEKIQKRGAKARELVEKIKEETEGFNRRLTIPQEALHSIESVRPCRNHSITAGICQLEGRQAMEALVPKGPRAHQEHDGDRAGDSHHARRYNKDYCSEAEGTTRHRGRVWVGRLLWVSASRCGDLRWVK